MICSSNNKEQEKRCKDEPRSNLCEAVLSEAARDGTIRCNEVENAI